MSDMTITEFLLARIEEDESEARLSYSSFAEALRDQGMPLVADWLAGKESRVLAECEAKRRIVELHDGGIVEGQQQTHECDGTHGVIECGTLMALALPHADHPDYLEEWRP